MVTASDQDIYPDAINGKTCLQFSTIGRFFSARVDCTETTAIPNIFY